MDKYIPQHDCSNKPCDICFETKRQLLKFKHAKQQNRADVLIEVYDWATEQGTEMLDAIKTLESVLV